MSQVIDEFVETPEQQQKDADYNIGYDDGYYDRNRKYPMNPDYMQGYYDGERDGTSTNYDDYDYDYYDYDDDDEDD